MTTAYWLKTATQFLQSKSITTARLDALVLLEDVLKTDRAKILAEPTMELKDGAVRALQDLLVRRSRHEPLAYIRGKSEFYGRVFKVSDAVLVPRPESEAMIELLKGMSGLPAEPRVADIGSGSGNLGITAALELPAAVVDLLDIDDAALEIAALNVVLHTTDCTVIKSDLLAQSSGNYDALLCNLPYIPDDYIINRAAKYEPKIALFAGPDGLDLFRRLFEQIQNLPKKPLFILCESLPEQHTELAALATGIGYELAETSDFIQILQARN